MIGTSTVLASIGISNMIILRYTYNIDKNLILDNIYDNNKKKGVYSFLYMTTHYHTIDYYWYIPLKECLQYIEMLGLYYYSKYNKHEN